MATEKIEYVKNPNNTECERYCADFPCWEDYQRSQGDAGMISGTILATFMIVGGFSCLGIQVLSSIFPALVQSLALAGKLCLAASFAVIYIHSGEIFPTTIRNSAMGLVSVSARLGGILAPFIVTLGSLSPNLQFTVFGLMSLTAGLLNLKLPETRGARLPESVAELVVTLQPGWSRAARNDKFKDLEASGLLSDQSDD